MWGCKKHSGSAATVHGVERRPDPAVKLPFSVARMGLRCASRFTWQSSAGNHSLNLGIDSVYTHHDEAPEQSSGHDEGAGHM